MPIWLIQVVVGIVLSVASTLIQQAFRQDTKQKTPGVRGSIQSGGEVPLSFIVGRYATPGYFEYAGTWGNDSETPNAYFTKVISVSDLPVRGLAGLFVNGVRCTIGDAPNGDLGYPVVDYTTSEAQHLWIKFYDGTQTAADPLLLSAFGSHPDRPWQADMIGRGVAYAVVTALVNRELFTTFPDYLFEVDGIEFNDPRGDDEQENPAVAIENLLRGLYYDGDWFYGPQGIGDAHLPATDWQQQMDKCDVAVPKAGGGSEKRFRIGLEISVDQEPHAVVGELLKACEGRIAEVGGIYKLLVGEPDAAVKAFSDEDLIITQGQSYEPFPGLEATHNAITATYPEPAEAWESKEAPPRYNSTFEAADDGRRLPFATSYTAVPYANQVQRLMRAAIEEARRFRRHSFTAPPEWWEYEVLDTVEWSSGRNGYEAKKFLITVMEDLPNANQVVGLQEIDPSDYDWESGYQLPWDTAPLVISRPPPQQMTGTTVAPYIHQNAAGQPSRPGIEVGLTARLVDVRSVRVQVRRAGETAPFFDGEYPYDPLIADVVVFLVETAILSNQPYEVRAKYLPFSGRQTLWSNQDILDGEIVEGPWLAVTTPTIPDITLPQILEVAGKVLNQMGDVRRLIEQAKQTGTLLEAVDRENFHLRQTLIRDITVQFDNLTASFTEVIEVALGPGGVIATALSSLYAAMGGNNAQVNIRWEAAAAPAGMAARYAITAEVNDGQRRPATFFIDVPIDPDEPTRIGLMAGQTVFFTSTGTPMAIVDEDGFLRSANNAVVINLLTGDFSFGAS